MPQPTLIESMAEAERHLIAALKCLEDARNTELDLAKSYQDDDDDSQTRRKVHMLANQSLAAAEDHARKALSVVSC